VHESNEHDIFFGGGASGVVFSSEEDQIALTTIGVDIGSSTFHFMFTAVYLARDAFGHFGIVKREIIWRSPVYLTPYRRSKIDASAISLAIDLGHQAARIPADHVESGAVILTGEALRTDNAQALASEIGQKAGNFVGVSAGHHLESVLAAFGSGAVGVARSHDRCLLHVDIGGGTTKFAIVDPTGVRHTAAINGGGRVVALDSERRITRIGAGARAVGNYLGFALSVGEKLSEAQAEAIAEAIADAIVTVIDGVLDSGSTDSVEPKLRVTRKLERGLTPEAISFSGGVSEYLYEREHRSFGDIGSELAACLRARLSDDRIALPLVDPGEGIRATVIGAAQSTMQLSRNPVDESADEFLPLNDVPVVHPHLERSLDEAGMIGQVIRTELDLFGLRGTDPLALSISWDGSTVASVRRLAQGISEGLGSKRVAPTIVLTDGRYAAPLEKALREDFPLAGGVVCIEGLHLSPLEYLDVGRRIAPSGVVPIVIKSLMFEVPDHRHVTVDSVDQTEAGHTDAVASKQS
jgi:ethanolamine utilization protein EutA